MHCNVCSISQPVNFPAHAHPLNLGLDKVVLVMFILDSVRGVSVLALMAFFLTKPPNILSSRISLFTKSRLNSYDLFTSISDSNPVRTANMTVLP